MQIMKTTTDPSKYIKKSHLKALEKFKAELEAFRQETGEEVATLYEDAFTSFTLSDIEVRGDRVYYMYDTCEGVVRGCHAHKNLQQILICIHGSCKIKLDNGEETSIILLDKPYEGLFVSNAVWREMYEFSSDAVLMVLASELYDETDYIRNYDEFLTYVKQQKSLIFNEEAMD